MSDSTLTGTAAPLGQLRWELALLLLFLQQVKQAVGAEVFQRKFPKTRRADPRHTLPGHSSSNDSWWALLHASTLKALQTVMGKTIKLVSGQLEPVSCAITERADLHHCGFDPNWPFSLQGCWRSPWGESLPQHPSAEQSFPSAALSC